MSEMTSAYNVNTNKEVKVITITKSEYKDYLYCYCCDKPVIAKAIKSTSMEAHFAHTKKDKTEALLTPKDKKALMVKYGETLLHKRAKEYISTLSHIVIPLKEQKVENQQIDYNGEIYYPDKYCNPKELLNITKGLLETKRIDVIPDVILEINKNNHIFELFVEIYVTHKVDFTKREKIIKNNQNCIQINLKDFDLKKLDDISYFQKEMININNYQYINLNYAGLEQYKYDLNENYLILLEQHNNKIINQREYFIKLAKNKEEIIKIQDSDIKHTYQCLYCNNEMKSNGKNYYHIKKPNCIVFNKQKNAGILYSQRMMGHLFFNSLQTNKNIFFNNNNIVLENKKLINEDNQYIHLRFKGLNRIFKFVICFDQENYNKSKRMGYSIVNLINWKTYNSINSIINPQELLCFNLRPLDSTELEQEILELKQRKNENTNNIYINLCIDNDSVINKTEIEKNKKYKCILCQNTIFNNIHEEIDNCLIFNDYTIDNTKLLTETQNKNNKYYIFYNYLKEKLVSQEIDYGYILSRIKIDFDNQSQYSLDYFLKKKYLLKLKDIILIQGNIKITFEDKDKNLKVFYIKIKDNFFFAIYNLSFRINLEESNIIGNKSIEDFFVKNFSEIDYKETKEINNLIVKYNNIRKESREKLIKYLILLKKSCKNQINTDFIPIELRLKEYKITKLKNYLYNKEILVNNIKYKINTVNFDIDNHYNIKNILINNYILIKKGTGKIYLNSFFENIYEGEKNMILATIKFFDNNLLDNNIFYLPENFTNNILINKENHIKEIIKKFFTKDYYYEMLKKSKDLSEDFFKYYNNNFHELQNLINNEENYDFLIKIINNENQSLFFEKIKSINLNQYKQKFLLLNNLENIDFELFFKIFNGIEIFTEEEQKKILTNNYCKTENKICFVKNKSKILSYNFLENEANINKNTLAVYILNIKNGKEIDITEFDEIIKKSKLRFGKII